MKWLVILTAVLVSGFVNASEIVYVPTHDGNALKVDWSSTEEQFIKKGAKLTSAQHSTYEYVDILVLQFTKEGKLKNITIRYSGEGERFWLDCFENMLKYYQKQNIKCDITHYIKKGQLDVSTRALFEVKDDPHYVVLERWAVKAGDRIINNVFIHAYPKQYYTVSDIFAGYQKQ